MMTQNLTKIAEVVMPLMGAAKERAAKEARAYIDRTMEKLAEHGMDAQAAFPYPSGNDSMYHLKVTRYKDARRFAEMAPGQQLRRMRDPEMMSGPNVKGQESFVEQAQKDAEAQYLAFVSKLEAKIGEVTEATLSGEHVWGYSLLTVTKPDGTIQRWRTQQIVNMSKHGLLFNQWPTRKVK